MKQDLFLQREESVQAHPLGELQKDYAIRSGKQIAIGGLCLLLVLIILFASSAINDTTFIIITALFYPLVISIALGGWFYYHRRLRVSVYTGGLIYINRNERKAVRWEQINNVYRGGGMNIGWQRAVNIDWGGPREPTLRLTSLIDDIDTLYSTIKREVDNLADRPAPFTLASPTNGPTTTTSDSGQPTFADLQQPTTSLGEQFGSGLAMPISPGQQRTVPASQVSVPPTFSAAVPQPPGRRRRWIIWRAIGVLVVIGLVLFGVIVFVNGPTPTSTLNAFCSALKSGDYQTAYHQFSSGLQSQLAETQFAAGYVDASNLGPGKITNCTVTNVNDAAGSGTISTTFANGSTVIDDVTFVNQSGTWEIKSYQPRSTPTLTLLLFCSALKGENYPTAYNQLSRRRHLQLTEAEFTHIFISDAVTNCMVSNVNDTAGTGNIGFTYADGSSNIRHYGLIDENGTWKINLVWLHP